MKHIKILILIFLSSHCIISWSNYEINIISKHDSEHTIAYLRSLMTTARGTSLIRVSRVLPSVSIDMRYASKNNCYRRAMYPPSQNCYLRLDAILALYDVQDELNSRNLGLKIWNAYCPQSIACILWNEHPNKDLLKGTCDYRNSRGTSLDVTLIDMETGKELAMPTDFNNFSRKAWRGYDNLSAEVKHNRDLLTQVMQKHGFIGAEKEWYHFDFHNWENCEVLTLSFELLNEREESRSSIE